MKATELMIGDWAFVAEYDEYTPAPHNKPYPVQILHGADIDRADEISFEPIPLTPKILEKNGYEFVDDSNISISAAKLLDDYTSIYFQFCNNKDCYFQLHHCGAESYEIRKYIEYVHELQHALRLCELDELADNLEI